MRNVLNNLKASLRASFTASLAMFVLLLVSALVYGASIDSNTIIIFSFMAALIFVVAFVFSFPALFLLAPIYNRTSKSISYAIFFAVGAVLGFVAMYLITYSTVLSISSRYIIGNNILLSLIGAAIVGGISAQVAWRSLSRHIDGFHQGE